MSDFIILDEIVDRQGVITHPIYVKISSINGFKISLYAGSIASTQVMLQNDCIWVTNTPEEIMRITEAE